MSGFPRRCSRRGRACRTRCGCAGRRRGWWPGATGWRITSGTGWRRSRGRTSSSCPGIGVRTGRTRRRPSWRRWSGPTSGGAARRHLDRRLRAGGHGTARRAAGHDALALHAGARGPPSAGPGGRERAVRGRGHRADLGRGGVRYRPVPAHPARGPRGGRLQPRGPAAGRRAVPQWRAGPVRTAQRARAAGGAVRRHPGVGAVPARRAAHPGEPGASGRGLAADVLPAVRRGDRLHTDAVGDAGPPRPGPRTAGAVAAGVEQIAADVGLGTGANLRLHFQRILGTTPSEYRRTFTRGD